ncbi:type II toxin-antitoxin system RelE/ParE family toxin [Amaricoccus sp.]|uniref:type II toxin-antitoxin system RelE/ParE family toxin n=1 Tax=Amaricoccus sp. TaxID=1872485 RepID=UPI001B4B306C|nr:type II toxin-antitoxin system RelE/ParE family toxin [Amaricoccus sp.]
MSAASRPTPGGGRRRDAFRPGLRSFPCGAHVVSYLALDGGAIGIVRVLHARQNVAALRWREGIG